MPLDEKTADARLALSALTSGYYARASQLKKAGLKQLPALSFGKGVELSPSAVAEVRAYFNEKEIPELSTLHFRRAGRRLCDMACAAAGIELPAALTPPPGAVPAISAPEVKSPLSASRPGFLDDLSRAAEKLSPGQRRLLTEFNLKTHVGRRLEEFAPEVARTQARGYDRNLTMDHGPAFFTPWKAEITMLQEHKHYPADDIYVLSKAPHFFYLHECGHAVSLACNEISEMALLARAYAKDVARLETLAAGPAKIEKVPTPYTSADTLETVTGYPERCLDNNISAGRRFNLRYFLSRDEGGAHVSARPARNEAVAELFAIRACGGEQPNFKLLDTFPETAAALDRILTVVEAEMTREAEVEALLPVNWRDGLKVVQVPPPPLPSSSPPTGEDAPPKPPQP